MNWSADPIRLYYKASVVFLYISSSIVLFFRLFSVLVVITTCFLSFW